MSAHHHHVPQTPAFPDTRISSEDGIRSCHQQILMANQASSQVQAVSLDRAFNHLRR